MIGDISPSALAAAVADCADNDSVTMAFSRFVEDCGARYAFAYRFETGLQSAAKQWTPFHMSFPAEIVDYYRDNQCLATDRLARAAFGTNLPVRLSDVIESFDMSPVRQGLHALFARHAIVDMLAMHVCDRPGRTIYVVLAYDRPLDGICELDRRRLHAAVEMFMRHAGSLGGPEGPAELSPKEQDVVTLLARGASNKEIARRLGLAPSTVNTVLQRCFQKLDAHTRAEAAIAASRSGLALVA